MQRSIAIIAAVFAVAALSASFLLYGGARVRGSDHQDSPATVARPGADITDVFVFPAANPRNVVLAMDVHPLIPAGMGTSAVFDPGVMYQFKIDTTGDYVEDKVIQFRASGTGAQQTIAAYGPATPAMTGPQSRWLSTQALTTTYDRGTQGNGMQFFAGPRKDPFYFDLAQFFKIIPDRDYKNHPNVPAPSASCFRKPGIDFLRDYNVLSLIVEVPRATLAGPDGKLGVVHVYATTSVAGPAGTYRQIERLGRPAVKEAFEAFDRHDTTNRSAPTRDPYLGRDIVAFMTASPPAGAGRSLKLARAVEQTLIPDEMTANLAASGPARYLAVETHGKSALPTGVVRTVPTFPLGGVKKALGDPYRYFGGRDPSSPVIDLSLGVIFGTLGQKVGLAPDDHKETACLTSDNVVADTRGVTKTFPYIGSPI